MSEDIDIPASLATRVVGIERPDRGFAGKQVIVAFDNGYAASVVSGPFTYGGSKGFWELAVLNPLGGIDYSTPITDDVVGWLSVRDVIDLLTQVSKLPEVTE